MITSSIKITISKDGTVPVKEQLIEQIGLHIASGGLKAREKLPSIRQLAKKLDIHHSTVTAAYNHLEAAGLLEIRQGSGVRVAGRSAAACGEKETGLEQIFKQSLARAAESGLSRSQVRSFVEKILTCKPISRIVVVDRNEDFHPLISAELSPHFSLPVVPITFQDLCKKPDFLTDSLLVTSFYHLYPLQTMDLDPTRLVVCAVEPGEEEMRALAALSAGSLVAIISVSQTLLKMANNMAAALKGDQIAVRCLNSKESQEIAYTLRHADLILCDGPSETVVRQSSSRVPLKIFRLYSPNTISQIKDRLEKWG